MLEIIYIWFINLCKIYAIYFIFISIFSIFGKKKEKETNKKLRFAVLIAARNEEKTEFNQRLLFDLVDKIDETVIDLLLQKGETRDKFFVNR